jgi:hypothetical protein
MLAYNYVPGVTAYEAIEKYGLEVTNEVMRWWGQHFTTRVSVPEEERLARSMRFYRDKTMARVEMLSPDLQGQALDVVSRIDWDALVQSTRPVIWHGDLNFGNIVYTANGENHLYAIDWREDFAGALTWGDQRYDLGKLLAGTVIHWQRAQRGDLRPWPEGEAHAELLRGFCGSFWIEVIGGLTLINSAPLHAPPLDEVLVARGCAWLEGIGL